MSKNDISDEIKKILDEYNDEVVEVVNDAIEVCSQASVRELNAAGSFKNRTGKYRKGWKTKNDKYVAGVKNKVVHNESRYRLTHLLEYGHVNRNGSRTKAFPHIARVEANAIKYFKRIVKRKL